MAILTLLRGGEMRAGEIAKRFETTRPAISEHLRVLAGWDYCLERIKIAAEGGRPGPFSPPQAAKHG